MGFFTPGTADFQKLSKADHCCRHEFYNWIRVMHFFSQSMRIKLALPQAAWLSIFFIGKSVVLHGEGPELRTHY